MITVRETKRIAKDWVEAEAPNIPNFRGAFLIGSILWKNGNEPQPKTSDVVVRIVVDIDPPTLMSMTELGQEHQIFKGITIDSGFNSIQGINTPEQILTNQNWACNFSVPNILSDPSGQLSKIQKAVSMQFPKKKWGVRRIEEARGIAISSLDSLQTSAVIDCGEPLCYYKHRPDTSPC
jgi:hypothetical protein